MIIKLATKNDLRVYHEALPGFIVAQGLYHQNSIILQPNYESVQIN